MTCSDPTILAAIHSGTCQLAGSDRAIAPGSTLGRKLACCRTLPVLALAANVGDLDTAMALSDTAERSTGFDRLELFGVADQHDLGAALFGLADHPLELTRTDHPGLVDDEDRPVGQEFTPLPPLMLEAGDGA